MYQLCFNLAYKSEYIQNTEYKIQEKKTLNYCCTEEMENNN